MEGKGGQTFDICRDTSPLFLCRGLLVPITFSAVYRAIKLQMSPIELTLLLETVCVGLRVCLHASACAPQVPFAFFVLIIN